MQYTPLLLQKRICFCHACNSLLESSALYAHQLLRTLLWTIPHDCGLILIPTHSLNMLHTTDYEVN